MTAAHYGALSVPIYPASVFAFSDADEGAAIHNEEKDGYYYGRLGNPTQRALEAVMVDLENGESALALASGMAAISAAILTLVRSGEHIVAPQSMYATTTNFLHHIKNGSASIIHLSMQPMPRTIVQPSGPKQSSFGSKPRPTRLFSLPISKLSPR